MRSEERLLGQRIHVGFVGEGDAGGGAAGGDVGGPRLRPERLGGDDGAVAPEHLRAVEQLLHLGPDLGCELLDVDGRAGEGGELRRLRGADEEAELDHLPRRLVVLRLGGERELVLAGQRAHRRSRAPRAAAQPAGSRQCARRARSSPRSQSSAASVSASVGGGFGTTADSIVRGSCEYRPLPSTSTAARTSYGGAHAAGSASCRKKSSSAILRMPICRRSSSASASDARCTSGIRAADQRDSASSRPSSVRACAMYWSRYSRRCRSVRFWPRRSDSWRRPWWTLCVAVKTRSESGTVSGCAIVKICDAAPLISVASGRRAARGLAVPSSSSIVEVGDRAMQVSLRGVDPPQLRGVHPR